MATEQAKTLTPEEELANLEAEEAALELQQLEEEEASILAQQQEPTVAETPGMVEQAMSVISKIQAAPRAAALPVAAKGLAGIPEGLKAGAEQLFEEPEMAPTWREVGQVAGIPETKLPIPTVEPGIQAPPFGMPEAVPTEIPASEAFGLGAEEFLDPTQIILGGAKKTAALAQKVPVPGAVKFGAKLAQKTIKDLPANARSFADNIIPSIRDKYVSQFWLANRTGIDPDLLRKNAEVMYGKDSFFSIAKGAQRGIGEKEALENFEALNTQIGNAIRIQISDISKGSPVGLRRTVGQTLMNAYDSSVKKMFDMASTRYSNALKFAPNATISDTQKQTLIDKLAKLAEEQQEIASYSIDENVIAEANANLKAIQKIIPSVDSGDIEKLIKQMSQVGKDAFSKVGRNLPGKELAASKRTQKDIWGSIRETITQSFEEANEDVANSLKDSNKRQSEFFQRAGFISDLIDRDKAAPEKVYEGLILSGDSRQLAALKSIFQEYGQGQALGAAKAQFLLDKMGWTVEDTPAYVTVKKTFKNNPQIKQVKDILFDPGELSTVEDLVDMGVDLGAKKINPSGSGIVSLVSSAMGGLKSFAAKKLAETAGMGALEYASYDKYFKDMPLQQIIDLKKTGLFEDQILDQVIAGKMKDPIEKQKIASARMLNSLTPDMQDSIKEKAAQAGPSRMVSIIKEESKALSELIGLMPEPAIRNATKVLQTVSRIQQEQEDAGGATVPVFIPEEDREDIIKAIRDSSMSSIQQARNIKNLGVSGYLLDVRSLSKKTESPLIKKVMDKNGLKPSKTEALKQDKPDMLKAMTREPQSIQEGEEVTPEADTREVYSAMESEGSEGADVEKVYDEIIGQLMGQKFTQEEAEQLAQKQLGFNPKSYKDGEGPSDEEIALEVEKEWDDEVLQLIQEGMTKEEAEAAVERVFGFNPNKEKKSSQPELMRIISEKYRRLQEEGRL